MLNIGCLVVNEDYDMLKASIKEESLPNHSYTLTVTGTPEGGAPSTLVLYVVELVSTNIAIGFTLPEDKEFDKNLEIIFTTQPTAEVKMPEDIKVNIEFSDQKKDTVYDGEKMEKLEYIGFSLEKFYETKKAGFYLFDYERIAKS